MMKRFSIAWLWVVLFSVTAALSAEDSNQLQDNSHLPAVKKILETAAADEPVWSQISAVAALKGKETEHVEFAASLTALSKNAAPEAKIVLGGALLTLGEQKDGTLIAEEVVTDKNAPLHRRLEAASVLGAYGGEYTNTRLRALLKDAALPELLQAELAGSLWNLTFDPAAKERLQNIAFKGQSRRAAIAATLALGRIGQYESGKADDPLRAALRELAEIPGETGAQAKMLQKLDVKNKNYVSQDKFTGDLLSEIVQKIRTRYAFNQDDADEMEQTKPDVLAANAARALVRSLDDFSDYLDADDYQEMLNSMHGDYGGIGAYVGMRNGFFTVLTPMWGKPAYKAGLHAMDVITKIDGVDITKMNLDKIIKRLKGKPETTVKVMVMRKGWDEPQEVQVKRELINMPMMLSQKLPGNIGYIRLTGFQEDPTRRISTSSELKRALIAFKKDNIAGVILDLRNNPGGLLTEAVAVCENFLKRNQLIVYSKGTFQPRRNYVSKVIGEPAFTGPLVVLINGGSASASEIVSGALRDHKRATLVGEKSFGKGSVQMLLPVETASNARLKLTIAKYYLPSGECIHGRDKGIKPHVEAEELKFTPAERQLRLKQMENRDISVWLEENFDKNKEAFMGLLEYDDRNSEKYPGFEGLYKLLTEKYPDIKMDKEIVRRELRSNLFAFIRESRGIEEFPVDISESEVLQRGIEVLGEKIGGLPDIPVYNAFKGKWKEADAKKAAEAAKKAAEAAIINGDSAGKTKKEETPAE